jgi:hypothetical protein
MLFKHLKRYLENYSNFEHIMDLTANFTIPLKEMKRESLKALPATSKLMLLPRFRNFHPFWLWMSGYHLVARCSMLNHAANRRLVFRSDLILPLSKHTFDCCSRREAKVNHYSLIVFDRNQYSVPVTYPGNILTVKGYMGEVRIYDKQTLVAVHALLWKRKAGIYPWALLHSCWSENHEPSDRQNRLDKRHFLQPSRLPPTGQGSRSRPSGQTFR